MKRENKNEIKNKQTNNKNTNRHTNTQTTPCILALDCEQEGLRGDRLRETKMTAKQSDTFHTPFGRQRVQQYATINLISHSQRPHGAQRRASARIVIQKALRTHMPRQMERINPNIQVASRWRRMSAQLLRKMAAVIVAQTCQSWVCV